MPSEFNLGFILCNKIKPTIISYLIGKSIYLKSMESELVFFIFFICGQIASTLKYWEVLECESDQKMSNVL